MQLIDGRAIADKIRQEVKEEITRLGITPGLGVILVGNDPASYLYVSLKQKACQEVGIKFEKYVLPTTDTHKGVIPRRAAEESRADQNNEILRYAQNDNVCGCEQCIINLIRNLNVRPDIHGILVQVPLPPPYNKNKIISTLEPDKDVDGFHQVNLRATLEGEARIIPGVALGVDALIGETLRVKGAASNFTEQNLEVGPFANSLTNKKAVLLMNSTTFALPIEYLLEGRGALVHIILRPSEITPEIIAQLKTADIFVVAIGRPQIIKGDMLKDGAIVIDVGTNRLPDGKLVGDVDFETTQNKPGFITPVPGGVGPMTVAMLLRNTIELAKAQSKAQTR
ncbi:MAG: Bifunctional protein FolD [Parcubacteria group bacterium GW2011_GWA2_47_26]|nr:MAG: Bifunctional protein FolD [Parcubacteria group bacterium GW2011_GWA2_47_26]